MAKSKVITDVRDDIMEEIEKQERTVTWLSKKTGIPYTTMYNILKHKISSLDENQLRLINNILNTKFRL